MIFRCYFSIHHIYNYQMCLNNSINIFTKITFAENCSVQYDLAVNGMENTNKQTLATDTIANFICDFFRCRFLMFKLMYYLHASCHY